MIILPPIANAEWTPPPLSVVGDKLIIGREQLHPGSVHRKTLSARQASLRHLGGHTFDVTALPLWRADGEEWRRERFEGVDSWTRHGTGRVSPRRLVLGGRPLVQ